MSINVGGSENMLPNVQNGSVFSPVKAVHALDNNAGNSAEDMDKMDHSRPASPHNPLNMSETILNNLQNLLTVVNKISDQEDNDEEQLQIMHDLSTAFESPLRASSSSSSSPGPSSSSSSSSSLSEQAVSTSIHAIAQLLDSPMSSINNHSSNSENNNNNNSNNTFSSSYSNDDNNEQSFSETNHHHHDHHHRLQAALNELDELRAERRVKEAEITRICQQVENQRVLLVQLTEEKDLLLTKLDELEQEAVSSDKTDRPDEADSNNSNNSDKEDDQEALLVEDENQNGRGIVESEEIALLRDELEEKTMQLEHYVHAFEMKSHLLKDVQEEDIYHRNEFNDKENELLCKIDALQNLKMELLQAHGISIHHINDSVIDQANRKNNNNNSNSSSLLGIGEDNNGNNNNNSNHMNVSTSSVEFDEVDAKINELNIDLRQELVDQREMLNQLEAKDARLKEALAALEQQDEQIAESSRAVDASIIRCQDMEAELAAYREREKSLESQLKLTRLQLHQLVEEHPIKMNTHSSSASEDDHGDIHSSQESDSKTDLTSSTDNDNDDDDTTTTTTDSNKHQIRRSEAKKKKKKKKRMGICGSVREIHLDQERLEESLAEVQEQLRSKKMEMTAAAELLRKHESELESAQDRMRVLEQNCLTAQDDNRRLRQSLHDVQAQLKLKEGDLKLAEALIDHRRASTQSDDDSHQSSASAEQLDLDLESEQGHARVLADLKHLDEQKTEAIIQKALSHLQNHREEAGRLRQDKEYMQDAIRARDLAAQRHRDYIQKMDKELKTKEDECEELQIELKQTYIKQQDLLTLQESTQKEVEQLRDMLDLKDKEIKEACSNQVDSQRLCEAQEESLKLRQSLAKVTQKLTQVEKEYASLLVQSEQEKCKWVSRLQALKLQLETGALKQTQTEEAFHRLQQEFRAKEKRMNSELEKARTQLEQRERQYIKLTEENHKLQLDVAMLTGKISNVEARLEDKASEAAQSQLARAVEKKEMDGLRQKVDFLFKKAAANSSSSNTATFLQALFLIQFIFLFIFLGLDWANRASANRYYRFT